jgi:hypothetical protein
LDRKTDEKPIALEIISKLDDLSASAHIDEVAVFRLGTDGEGVEVSFTKAQYLDLIAGIGILRDGTEKVKSYQIGKSAHGGMRE